MKPIHLIATLLPAALGLSAPALSQAETKATASAAAADEAAPKKAKKKAPAPVHYVRFSGNYLDLPEAGGDLTTLLLSGGIAEPKGFYDMREELENVAGKDGEMVFFDLTRSFSFNAAQMSAVERSIGKLRSAGKTCHAYLENGNAVSYQIAAMCDKIHIADLGSLDVPSPAMSVMFMKDALDLIGVDFEVVRCGEFKGAVEPYLLSSMSSHLREHYQDMLESINRDTTRRIATGRRMSEANVRKAQAQRLFTAKQAKAAGLVDRLTPWRGARRALDGIMGDKEFAVQTALRGKKRKENFNPMSALVTMFRKESEEEIEDSSVVVLHLSGQIVDGHKAVPGSIVSGPTVKTIERLIDNEEVKGVVVRINSPGGSATASEAILLALQELSSKKPVAISMGRLAASGGYYVTCIGRPIFAEPGTITGSIGVFSMRPVTGAIMRRIGVHNETVALDDSAGMTAIDQPWNDEQRAQFQTFVDGIYDVFISHVSRSRKLPTTEVLEIAGGRVWAGQQAVDNGLVDEIGGLDAALALVVKESGLKEDDYEVLHMPKPKSFIDTLADELASASISLPENALQLGVVQRLGLDRALRLILDSMDNTNLVNVQALMPQAFSIR